MRKRRAEAVREEEFAGGRPCRRFIPEGDLLTKSLCSDMF